MTICKRDQLQTLWVENRKDLIISIISDSVAPVILSLIVLGRDTIIRFLRKWLFREFRSQEEQLFEAETTYLQNVIARFRVEESWDTTKYTDLNAVFQDLEMEWRYVKPRLWKPSGVENAPVQTEAMLGRRIRLMPFLQKKHRVMLKGDPGTGKTLTLRRFAVCTAEEALKASHGRRWLPLYVSLREYRGQTQDGRPQPVYDFLHDYIAAEYPSAAFLREHLTEYLNDGRLILLFDGVNEMPPEDYVERLDQLVAFTHCQYPRNQAIYTCRTLHYTSSEFDVITITDLDDDQVLQFLEAYRGPEAARAIFQELASGDRFMLRLCRNPFMLRMLACRAQQRTNVPENRTQLFQEFIEDQLEPVFNTQSTQVDEVLAFLRRLAFAMHKDRLFAGSVTEDWISQAMPEGWERNHLELAATAQLIDRTMEGKVRFYHQILQEYFAASELIELFNAGESVDAQLGDLLWEETVILAAGLHDQPEIFIRRLWDPDNGSIQNLWLAAKAMGASGRPVTPSYRQSILSRLAKHLQLDQEQEDDKDTEEASEKGPFDIVSAVESVKALGFMEESDSTELLAEAIRKHKGWVREVAIRSLGTMRGEAAHVSLVRAAREIASATTLWLVWPYLNLNERLELVYQVIQQFVRPVLGYAIFLVLVGALFSRIARYVPDIRYGLLAIPFGFLGRMFLAILTSLVKERTISIRTIARTILVDVSAMASFLLIVFLILALLALVGVFVHILGSLGQWLLILLLQCLVLLGSRKECAEGEHFADLVLSPFWLLLLTFVLVAAWAVPYVFKMLVGEVISSYLLSLSSFHLVQIAALVFLILVVVIQSAIVLYCMWCYLRATVMSFQMWRLSNLAQQPGMKIPSIEKLVKIVEDSSEWNKLRTSAARYLRVVDPLTEHVDRLKSVDATDRDLIRELERTVYELESRLREKQRRSAIQPQ